MTATSVSPKAKAYRFDPEGVRVGPRGTVFLADDYGPSVCEFDANGRRLRSLAVPTRFRPARVGKPNDEPPPKNLVGRQPNRGIEGLAISPDGKRLYAMLQSPLIQDGALDPELARIGVNCRLIEFNLATNHSREFVYPLEAPSNGLCEILAVNDREFLVIERDSVGGADAKVKKVFKIDLTGASDVSRVNQLPARGLPSGVTPVQQRLFIDLLDPKFELVGRKLPEKFEGLAFGPNLPDGRRLLMITADNDFVATAPFRLYAFTHQTFERAK